MAFVWMFGVLISMANACLLQTGPSRPRSQDSHAFATGLLADHAHPDDRASSSHADETPANAACREFCDLERTTAFKFEVVHGFEVLPPTLSSGVRPVHVAAAQSRPARPIADVPPTGPAVGMRFLRLTL